MTKYDRGTFGKLHYLDVRNNNISSIPMNVEKLMMDRKITEAYFHNNSGVCENDKFREFCEPLCSKYCFSRDHIDGWCDFNCNSEACQYDGGDCIDPGHRIGQDIMTSYMII